MVVDQFGEAGGLEADDQAAARAGGLESLDQLGQLAGEAVDGSEGEADVSGRAGQAREFDALRRGVERVGQQVGAAPGGRHSAGDAAGLLEFDAGVAGAVVALAAAFEQVGALVDDHEGVVGQMVEEVAAGDEGGPEVGAFGVMSVGDFVERVEQFSGFALGVGDAEVGQQVGGELARFGGDFAGRSEGQFAEVVERALGCGVEAAQAVDFVAEQFDADGGVGAGGPEVDDAAADGVVGGLDDEGAPLVAAGFEGGD